MTEVTNVPTSDPDDYDPQFEEWARESMREHERDWQARGVRFAWVDGSEPVWVSAADWDAVVFGFENRPTDACDRVFRLTLVGGGQLKVIERFRWFTYADGERSLSHLFYPWRSECCEAELRIVAHVADKVGRYTAFLSPGAICEMATVAAISRTAPQAVVDRAAATLRLIDTTPENFYALLDGATGCAFCRRPLTDEVSKLVGVGPDCARRHGVPHSLAAAGDRLKRRQQLLGQEG